MNTSKDNSRRRFLRNTSLGALALGIIPSPISAKTEGQPPATEDECNPTTLDYYGEGPFYTENPPFVDDGQLAGPDEPGTRLIITGRVYNLDCTEFIPDTVIDIWHANDAGAYDNTGFNLRGKVLSNSQGFFMFETVYPGNYPNGGSFRPSHIHIKVTAPDTETLTTQLYFAGDQYIESDAAASITEGEFDASHRIITLEENGQGKLEGTWDIVVDGDGITGVNNIHLEKGMIYQAGPNPFRAETLIRYGVFRESPVSLEVFNIQGMTVATLEQQVMQPGKYEAIWRPDRSMNRGYYFVVLKINQLQVHYQKVLYLGK
jgi:protocatechuate 3,4-dioxygenase beta subunit